MAFKCKTGSFTVSPGSDGSLPLTGFGFTPKLLLVWSSGPDGQNSSIEYVFGAATGTGTSAPTDDGLTDQAGIFSGHSANTGINNVSSHFSGNILKPRRVDASAGNARETIVLASFDIDGLTLTVSNSVNIASSIRYNYMAIGGEDIDNAAIQQVRHIGADGSQAIT